MNRRNLQFNALRAFEAAARHASVSGAAAELGVTHSAVSHQLRLLERELDVALFKRTNRGLRITPEGESLAPVLIESFDRIEEVMDRLRQVDSGNRLKVTCTSSFASKWLVPRLGDWYANTDAARISLQPSLEYLDFDSENIDIAIRCGIPPWDGLQHELLMPIHLVPVCSPAYAAQKKITVEPAEILQHDLLHADVGGQGLGDEWRIWLGGMGIDPPREFPGLAFHDPALAMQAAADGLGIAIGYAELIDRDLQAGRLVTASIHSVKHPFSYYTVYPESRRNSLPLKTFRNWIRQQAG